MDRKKFINLMGSAAAAAALSSCMMSCKKQETDTAPANVDFTLDLSQAANNTLNTAGGYLYTSGLIVAKTLQGNFIAVSKTCTHETYTVTFDANSHRFYCANHGASFSESGSVTGGPASRALKQYNTSLNGTLLRVYS